MATQEKVEVSPALAAAAFGGAAAANLEIDFGKPILKAILQSCDSLLGKRDDIEPFAAGMKGLETWYQMWQHVVVSSVARFIISEADQAGKGAHLKPPLDAKAKSELRLTAAAVKNLLDAYDDSDAADGIDPKYLHQGEVYTPPLTPQQAAAAKKDAPANSPAPAADASKKADTVKV